MNDKLAAKEALEKAAEVWPFDELEVHDGIGSWDMNCDGMREEIAAALLEAQADALQTAHHINTKPQYVRNMMVYRAAAERLRTVTKGRKR